MEQTVRVKRPTNPWMIIGWIILGSFVLCGGGCGAIILLGASTTTTTTTPGAASPTTAAEAAPAPTDFTIEVIETERSCYGSAGCVVSYRIVPAYIGAVPLGTTRWQVIYDVTGAESPKSDNFEVKGADFTKVSDGYITVPEGAVIVATPTRVVPA
jgi:hypothetical protein